jgi:hypothetical protein
MSIAPRKRMTRHGTTMVRDNFMAKYHPIGIIILSKIFFCIFFDGKRRGPHKRNYEYDRCFKLRGGMAWKIAMNKGEVASR